MREYLIDKDGWVCGLQHRDRRNDLLQAPCSTNNFCLPQGWQLQQVGYSHAHALTFFLSWDWLMDSIHRIVSLIMSREQSSQF